MRVTNKTRKQENDEIQHILHLKSQLTNFKANAKSSFSKQFVQKSIEEVENEIQNYVPSKMRP